MDAIENGLHSMSVSGKSANGIESVLEILHVEKRYPKFHLGPINISVPKGFATALIGTNGAGKTTLLDLIAGISLQKQGKIEYWGKGCNIDQFDIREEIGYVSANSYFPPQWNVGMVRNMMELGYQHFSRDDFQKLCKEFSLELPNERRQKSVQQMSDGKKMRLMLAAILARETKVLVLDEPASPLDPLMRDTLCNQFREYLVKGNGERSILFSTHNISDMELVTDYAIFMSEGKVIEQGFVEDLKEKYTIVRGELNQYESAKEYLLYHNANSFGFEGFCFSEDRSKLSFDLIYERPTLQQLSVMLLRKAEMGR